MSRTVVVRYEMRPESAEGNQALIENVFADLAAGGSDQLRYAAFRLADGVSFVHIAVTEGDGNPLGESAAFQEFQKEFGERAAGKPVAGEATLIGSYRFVRE